MLYDTEITYFFQHIFSFDIIKLRECIRLYNKEYSKKLDLCRLPGYHIKKLLKGEVYGRFLLKQK